MPYFKWVGVDITGTTKRGKKAAPSVEKLSTQLLRQGVGLLRADNVRTPSFLWPINAKTKADLFKQKAKLLRAGLLLPNVLEVIAQQSPNPIICDILFAVGHDIQHGVSLSKALEKHEVLRDPIVAVMLAAGHESGNIINASESVALYFHKQYIFNKNLRSALAMPFLTLLFFIGISFFIFVFIIPRFAQMFDSFGQELPTLTRYMIAISDFIGSSAMVYAVVIIAMAVFCIYRYCATAQGKKIRKAFIDNIPFIGAIMWQHHICQALQALALLINSGVPLVVALKVVGESVDHEGVKSQLKGLCHDVAAGQLLANTMAATSLFFPEVVALIFVGQESGTLGHSLEEAALVYNDKVEESLRRFVLFLQPVIIILLGLLVMTLIFAVYSPIMQLSMSHA
jgi:type IV pilus assembly protein PilC